MANATVSRLGQANKSGGTTALFLEKFTGDVLKYLNNAAIAANHVYKKSISEGISHKFDMVGKTVAAYHTPGAEITGTAIAHNEKTITVDGIHYSDVFVGEWDELINHTEVRSEYAKQLGEALAIEKDELLFRCAYLASQNATPICTDFNTGASLTLAAGNAAVTTSTFTAAFSAGLFKAAQNFAEKNVNMAEVKCFVKPDVYYALAQDTDLYNRDYSGGGDYSEGMVSKVAGVPIIKSNNVPRTNRAADDGLQNNSYVSDCSDLAALIFAPKAVALLERKGLTTEATYDERRFGTLMTARQVWGASWLRDDHAYAIEFSAA